MNQQFLNRQYQLRSIPTNTQQGYNLAINSIPSYTPLLHGGSKFNNIPNFQQIQNQQKINQPQLIVSPGPNQKHFLQNVPLVQSLPQNYATQFNFSPQQTQKQVNYSPNQVMSNTSSANFYSGNKGQQSHLQNNLAQQLNIQQTTSGHSSSRQLFYSPGNNNTNSSAQKDQDLISDNNQNKKNSEQNRPNSTESKNNEVINTQPSTKPNSVKQSVFQKQQLYPQVQKTPDRTQQKSPNFSYLSPSLFYLSDKKVEQVNQSNDKKLNLDKLKTNAFSSSAQKFYTENNEIQQNKTNNSSISKYDNTYLNTIQNIASNQYQPQKEQTQKIQTKTTLNESKDDQTINEEGVVLQISQAPKLAQNDISKQGQSNQKDKNNTIVHSKLKIPLEITYDGNQIIEGNKIQCSSKSNYTSIQTNTLTETNDKYPESLYYARSSHNQINQSRQKIQSIREEDQDLINQLRDQIKQLTQENTYLKKELFDQRQEYKILSSSHQELEKKYIYLQNQIVLPTSSCNSSLIIFQEDKNQQILYDIANNCSSLTKLQSKNSFSYPYNQSSSNQPNKMSFKREASPTNSEQFFQSQNLQYNNRTYISPQINNNQNINNIDHNSQLYNSINFESQLFSSVQPNSTLVNNQNQLQNRDEDYSYKKPNNNSKLDGQSLNLASQIQNKSKVQEEFQNLSHLIFNNQSNLSKLNEQILTNANSQIQLSQRFDTSNQIAHQNEYYSQQKQSAETESQINKQFNSVSPNKPSNNYSQQLDIQEAIKKADEIIRRSHYVPNQINSNELPVKRATTQYVQNTHK